MSTTFDSSLFMGLPAHMESKSLSSFLKPLRISRNTWKYWELIHDIPLVKMLNICKYYEVDPSVFFNQEGNPIKERTSKPKFRHRLFSDALSIFRHKTVPQACNELGISTATFARQLRPTNDNDPSISVSKYLKWCELTGLNPMDFIYEGDVKISVDY